MTVMNLITGVCVIACSSVVVLLLGKRRWYHEMGWTDLLPGNAAAIALNAGAALLNAVILVVNLTAQ